MPRWYHDDWQTWELDSSTRTSTHIYTKWDPVDVTLTTAGTAQNLYQVGTPDEPTVNLVTNPSFETGDPPTGYTVAGAAISQSAVVARNGSNSILVNPDNAAAGEGFYWSTDEPLGSGPDNSKVWYLTVSAYFHDNAGSGDDARIEIRDSAGTTTHATGNTITLAAAWARSTATFRLTAGADYRVYFVTVSQHNTNFYVDSFQVEVHRGSSNATAYCDGSLGNYYEWEGTAHASISRRRGALVAIRGFNLHNTRNCYIAFDQTASSTLGAYVRAGSDWNMGDHPINIRDRISFINELAGETPRIYGSIYGIHVVKLP